MSISQKIIDVIRLKIFKLYLNRNVLALGSLISLIQLFTGDRKPKGVVRLLNWIGSNCSESLTYFGYNLKIYKPRNLKLGKYVGIGDDSKIYAWNNISIGDYSFSSVGLTLVAGSHRTDDYSDIVENQNISIGKGVWIGANVTVTGGVTIGNGSIIGANSLVNTSIPPFSIAVGVPAKVIKIRETKEIIKQPVEYEIKEILDENISNNASL